MLVGPRHRFGNLADSIDAAFARWDLSHMHMFILPDGREVSTESEDWDVEDESSLLVTSTLRGGDRFEYIFDLGDDWRHECEVTEAAVDPREASGGTPRKPVAIWGWGWIPDQYGQRTEEE
jgi:Plasmid pRiA4b ORF-3-like protein